MNLQSFNGNNYYSVNVSRSVEHITLIAGCIFIWFKSLGGKEVRKSSSQNWKDDHTISNHSEEKNPGPS